jgi:hypothetical protein
VDGSSRSEYIPRLAATSTDRALADKVQAYTERAVPADARDAPRRTIAYIRLQAAMKDRQVPVLEAWLRNRRTEGLSKAGNKAVLSVATTRSNGRTPHAADAKAVR